MLTDCAQMTGGQYFRATDNRKLREIYDQINDLERSRVEVENFTRYDECFAPFALLAVLLAVAGFLLRQTWLGGCRSGRRTQSGKVPKRQWPWCSLF